MTNPKCFNSIEQFFRWSDSFEDGEQPNIPIVVDDGWTLAADMMTDCVSWKTAVKRFAKTFKAYEALADWIEGIYESCEGGQFKDVDGWKCQFTYDDEENKRLNEESGRKFGRYAWSVEQLDDKIWYIFVNISGEYAGHKARK